MKCYICDREDDLIGFDYATESYNPCSTCLAVIADCLGDFEEDEEDVGC